VNNSLKSDLTYKYLIAACLASLVISTFASYFFYDRWSEAEDRNIVMLNERNRTAHNYNEVKNSLDKMVGDLLVMRDENAKIIVLYPADTTKHSCVRVYWNSGTHETFVDVISLSASDSTKQYQLWAMSGGQPIDAGIFKVEMNEGIQRVKPVVHADAWVVTFEPKGGSARPTPDQVILLSRL
jgi:hypothetical protein